MDLTSYRTYAGETIELLAAQNRIFKQELCGPTRINGMTLYDSVVYGYGQNSSLYSINQSTGAASLIDPSGFTGVESALAADASGNLFTITSGSRFLHLDRNTGAGTEIGTITATNDFSGMTFVGNTLYGADSSLNKIFTIDLTDATRRLVGDPGISIRGTGGASTSSMTWNGTNLLLANSDGLHTLDINTGAALNSIAFSSNLAGRKISGAVYLGPTTVPEPSAMLLLLLGISALLLRRMKTMRSALA